MTRTEPELTADFRSDTVTRPTAEMLAAMTLAEVGDDVLGDDPTVRNLEAIAAHRFGREAGLFVPSGTMGNQCAIAAQTRPGDEIVIERDAHVFLWEAGGLARIAGVQVRALAGRDGSLDPADVAAAVRPDNVHVPRTSLVALEQTHLGSGGQVVPLEDLREVHRVARQHGLRVHLDGARIFHACVAAGVDPRDYGACCDSLTFCLSKGLSCPVGSVIVGDADFIGACRRVRKWMGGAMRQSGYLAACGIVALELMVDRLAEDHVTARKLAEGIAEVPGLRIDPSRVVTNIVLVETGSLEAADLSKRLRAEGVGALPMGPRVLRFVTHRHVGTQEVVRALVALRRVVGTDPPNSGGRAAHSAP